MQKNYVSIIIVCLLLCSKSLSAQWKEIKTGIKDDLNAIYFWDTAGVLAGNQGLYYTTSGGNLPSNWTRFIIHGNTNDSILYNHCRFYGITSDSTKRVYTCGWDSVANKAIIFQFDLNTLSYAFKYIGPVGSRLNTIQYSKDYKYLFAVGNKGLIIRSDLTLYQEVISPATSDLFGICIQSSYITIGGRNVFLYGNDFGNGISLTLVNYPGKTFYDVDRRDGDFISRGVGKTFYEIKESFETIDSINKYDFGPLDANCMKSVGPYGYIGTSHGIFRSIFPYSFLELQPTSAPFYINKIWFDPNDNFKGYAVGKNGILLSTKNGGGNTKPYATMDLHGTCTNSDLLLHGERGSALSCEWRINDSLMSYQCEYTYKFTKPGTYTIEYRTLTGVLSDTVIQKIQIVDSPKTTIPITSSSPYLCKQGSVIVKLDSTQKNFMYQLKRLVNNQVMNSALGNDSTLKLNIPLIYKTDSYYLHVQSTLANCESNFPDSIHITVEHTQANFQSSLINATSMEEVNFRNKSKEAQYYKWNFSPGASVSNDTTKDPLKIKYSIPGSTIVKLIVHSVHGCYDTLTEKGPFIYIEPIATDSSCWAFDLDGNDATWMGYYTPDVSQQVLTKDGYLICGSRHQNTFTSKKGNELGRLDKGGEYIAKYSRSGMLKWVDYGMHSTYNDMSSGRPYFSSVVNSRSGNIYAAGLARGDNGYFYLSTGDSVQLLQQDSLHYFNSVVAKMDANGGLIWSASLGSTPQKIKEDRDGNILIAGVFYGPFSYSINDKDTILFDNISLAGEGNFLIKLDSNGVVKWSTYFESKNTNAGMGTHDFEIDKDNNILITGGVEHAMFFHSVTNSTVHELAMPGLEYGVKLFIVKYDQEGNYKWVMSGRAEAQFHTVYSSAIAIDESGNSYITGYNGCHYSTESLQIRNADSSLFIASIGSYFLLKITPQGNVAWGNGCKYAYNSQNGGICVKDDEVTTIGSLSDFGGETWEGMMTSTGGNDVYYKTSAYDLFIATYSTNGVLKKILSTGPNPEFSLFWDNYTLLRDEKGNYYFSGVLQSPANGTPYKIGNDSFVTNGRDAFMAMISDNGCKSIVSSTNDKGLLVSEVSLYPNPVSEDISILIKHPFKIVDLKIYNSLGACVYSKRLTTQECTLDKSVFGNGKAGLYLMNFNSTDHTVNVSKKVIVND